jgi:hypothetical protein
MTAALLLPFEYIVPSKHNFYCNFAHCFHPSVCSAHNVLKTAHASTSTPNYTANTNKNKFSTYRTPLQFLKRFYSFSSNVSYCEQVWILDPAAPSVNSFYPDSLPSAQARCKIHCSILRLSASLTYVPLTPRKPNMCRILILVAVYWRRKWRGVFRR